MAKSTINKIIGFDELAYNHRKLGINFYGDPAEPQRFYSMITSPVSSSVYSWQHANYSPEVPAPAPASRYYALRLLSDQAAGILESIQVQVQSSAAFGWRVAPNGPNGPQSTSIASGTTSGVPGNSGCLANINLIRGRPPMWNSPVFTGL